MAPGTADDVRTAPPRDVLVQALIDQLAAGQSETLYSLQTAATGVRRRVAELDAAAARLPEAVAPVLVGLLDELVQASAQSAAAAGRELQDSLATETKRHASNLTATVKRATAAIVQAGDEAAGRVEVQRQQAETSLTDLLAQLHEAAAAVAESVTALDSMRATFAADAEAATAAMEAVGANVIERLIQVLDDRDQREQRLEVQLNRRVAADRATAAQQLTDLLDRLLALPRGKLKDLRADIARTQDKDVT